MKCQAGLHPGTPRHPGRALARPLTQAPPEGSAAEFEFGGRCILTCYLDSLFLLLRVTQGTWEGCLYYSQIHYARPPTKPKRGVELAG